MLLLQEITDQSLGLGADGEKLDELYRLRKSARAILLNQSGEMAVQYLENHGFHKLPGGGVEPGETVDEALAREIKEEVGCALQVTRPLGVVIEYRNEQQLLHISYGFSATVLGEIGPTSLEEKEVAEGITTFWLPPSEVLLLLEADQPDSYKAHFILEREKAILRAFLANTNQN